MVCRVSGSKQIFPFLLLLFLKIEKRLWVPWFAAPFQARKSHMGIVDRNMNQEKPPDILVLKGLHISGRTDAGERGRK